MSYRGMGQSIAEAVRRGGAQTVAASSPDWAGIERFARRAAGGMGDRFAGMFSAAQRSNQQAQHTAALRALADTIAVRPLAMMSLAQPASRHRAGLIAIAEFAARSGRASAPLVATPARAVQASGTVRSAALTSAPRTAASVSPMRDADVEKYLAQVRAELQKPRQQWHPDLVAVINAVEASKASPQASMAMLKRLLASTTGDARLVIAAMIVSIEQGLAMMQAMEAMAAQAPSQPASPPASTNLSPGGAIATVGRVVPGGVSSGGGSPPTPVPVGNYSY